MVETNKYTYEYLSRWISRALCNENADPDWFFEEEDLNFITDIKDKYCRQCPVQKHCLWTAINEDIRYGVWGGLTPIERLVFKRRLSEGMSIEDALIHIEQKWKEKVERKAKKDAKLTNAV